MNFIQRFCYLFNRSTSKFDFTSLPLGEEFVEQNLPTKIRENFQAYKVIDKNLRDKSESQGNTSYVLSEFGSAIAQCASDLHNKVWLIGYIDNPSNYDANGQLKKREKPLSKSSELTNIVKGFKLLHPEYQLENIRAAYAVKFSKELFPGDIEKQSEYIHYLWWYRRTLEKKVDDYTRNQMVHFHLLSESDKAKDRDQLAFYVEV